MMKDLLQDIDQLNQKLHRLRPFPPETLASIQKHFLVEMTYHSNSLEGNTLTLAETKVVLEDGITIGGKTVREHLEVINHKEAMLFLEECIKNEEKLTERTIKTIHALILRGIDSPHAGVYRKVKVLISGAKHIPLDPLFIEEEMVKLLEWYDENVFTFHPVECAAMLHSLLVKVHPFIDGNGRTARLLLNFELMKSGYVPIIIKNDQRFVYYQALDRSHVEGEYGPFVELVGKNLRERLLFYLDFMN
jgi:Fic family protein